MGPLPIPTKLTLSLIFAAACPRGIEAYNSAREIAIHVYDYASVEPVALAQSEALAGRILGGAGIDTRWLDCSIPRHGLRPQAACASASDGGINLVIRILPEHMSGKIAPKSKQLGTSISTGAGVFPTDAYIFFDRVLNLAEDEAGTWPALLGAVIAHEVGHLLLGDDSHFVAGIMRRKWGREEIKQILMGILTFTPRQAEQMRADVARRVNRN